MRTNTTATTTTTTRELSRVGYEIVERYDDARGVVARICFWLGDFNQQRVIDRTYNAPADRRCVASVTPNDTSTGSYTYRLHGSSAKGGWRSGSAKTYESALVAVDRWVRRRFALASSSN